MSHRVECACDGCRAPGRHLVRPENRPSLPAVAYRRGTFATVRQALLQRSTREPALMRLSTRQSDDHAVATVELWAVVADVLEFYSERYVNEVFVGTATQSRSVERLARLVGYRPRPGVASLAWLAFTLDSDTVAQVPRGLQVQSVPGPTGDGAPPPPVTFETLDVLAADARWNAIRAYRSPTPGSTPLAPSQTLTVLDRTIGPDLAATLAPNATVVLWGAAGVEEKTVQEIVTEVDRAAIRWTTPVAGTAGSAPQARRLDRVVRVFGTAAPTTWLKPTAKASAVGGIQWDLQTTSFGVAAGTAQLDMEGRVDDLEAGTHLLVVPQGGAPVAVTVTTTATASATVGPLTDAVTRLGVTPALPAYDLRTVRVYALAGPPLVFWGGDYPAGPLGSDLYVPVVRAVLPDGRIGVELGRRIEAGRWVEGAVLDLEAVESDRRLMVAADDPGVSPDRPRASAARLNGRPVLPAFDAGGFGHLRLDVSHDEPASPPWPALRSVAVLGNVIRASHGETVAETLGNGNAAIPFQRFALGRKPVTYLPARVSTGIVSTLSVATDGVIRPEVPSLYGQPPTARVIETATDPSGTTAVVTGDGRRMAARATTGAGNVRATYRVGSGVAGRVPAGRLSTLLAATPGVRSVVNPNAAEGGADAEPVGSARRNAPASVRTLGRIVSLRDAEALVLASGLVAKAQSVWLWSGADRVIHLTVAAQDGAPLSADLRSLVGGALDAARDTSHQLRVDDRTLVPVTLTAKVVIDKLAERPDLVLAATNRVARQALAFESVHLGTTLAVSDLIATIAAVPGVIGVDVDRFGYASAAGFGTAELDARGVTRLPDGSVKPVQARLRIFPARPGTVPGTARPAELPFVRLDDDVTVLDGGRA